MTGFLVFFLLIASGFGGGVLALSWYARRDDDELGPSALARELGLAPVSPHEASGERDGSALQVRWTTVPRGAGATRRPAQVMRYTASLAGTLDLELAHGALDELEPPRGAPLDPEPGSTVRGWSGEPARARSILARRDVQHALNAATRVGAVLVREGRVVVGHDGWAISADVVRAGIDAAHGLARALTRAGEGE